ncbi:MAG: hypothetical protein V5A68_04820 [Candidatus Thermoplasmatota archaeon]
MLNSISTITLQKKDQTQPYTMNWTNKTFGKQHIKAEVVDEAGYQNTDCKTVWKFL